MIHSACLDESNVFILFGLEPNFKKPLFHLPRPSDTAYAVFSVQPITLLLLTRYWKQIKLFSAFIHTWQFKLNKSLVPLTLLICDIKLCPRIRFVDGRYWKITQK
jgi:hypothetical protein